MSTAVEMLAAYKAAELAILQGKEVKFLDRSLGMEDLSEIRKGRQEWERRVSTEVAAAAGVPRASVMFSTARLD
jgi:hypothetical protein